MFFFQSLLLGGYFYAHVLTRYLSPRQQVVLHFILLATAAFFLPFQVSIAETRALAAGQHPITWLITFLSVTIGLPFLALSASAPLLQRWFSLTRHSNAADPYVLYAASNLGSLIALLSYPVLIEPFMRIHEQRISWAVLYGVLGVCFMFCGLALRVQSPQAPKQSAALHRHNSAPNLKIRLKWVLLAFIPSSMMLGVTTYLSTDIASIPLLWVIPLSIYLLTYVIAFSQKSLLPGHILVKAVNMSAIVLVFCMLTEINDPVWLFFSLHLAFFFIVALRCHTLLAEARPHTDFLTEFYLYLSLGGVLGGLFNAIIAPLLFTHTIEYPAAIVLACMFSGVPSMQVGKKNWWWDDYLLPLLVASATATMVIVIPRLSLEPYQLWMFIIFGLPLIVTYTFVNRPFRFSLSLGGVILASFFYTALHGQTLFKERNFFGTLRVTYEKEGPFHNLYHGTTIHGLQLVDPTRQNEPLAYYHRKGPFGEIVRAYEAGPAARSIGIVGLGAGSMLAYALPNERWTIYEIDSAVVKIARNDSYFTFISRSKASDLNILVGDARLRMAEAPDGDYGLIVIDAFSSDVIPIHLLTREAIALYLQKLTQNGIIAMNISSRHIDLTPVIQDLCSDADLTCLHRYDAEREKGDIGKFQSHWAVLSRGSENLGPLMEGSRWERLYAKPGAKPWTDDFSNLIRVLKWN
jgi:hypothetical protein